MKSILVFFLLFSCRDVLAKAVQDKAASNYSEVATATAHIKALSKARGLDEGYLQSLLQTIHRDDSVLEKIARPAEKTLPWYRYRKIFLDQARIENGTVFYRKHRAWFDRAYRRYGVDPFIITAIIGAETRYGKITGKTPALAALATLCFDYPPRAAFFCAQFDQFLLLAEQERWNPLDITGSYAGALGMTQFMPESYLKDAVDFDDDGQTDLWHSAADVIGSIANYLHKRGWQKEGKMVYRVSRKAIASHDGNTFPVTLARAEWMQEESLANDENFIEWSGENPPDFLASLTLQGEDGDLYWLTDNNFFVITRYNNSPLYAMAVIDLAAQIHSYVSRELSND